MVAWFRASLAAALFVFVSTQAPAADKDFKDDSLDDAAITLRADLKDESGTIELPLIKLKEKAAQQGRIQDLAGAAFTYGQIVTLAPEDSWAWRQLATVWLSIPPDENDDGTTRYNNARTAAYISYLVATKPKDEAAALAVLATAYGKGEEWRQALNALKLALKLDPTPPVQTTYDQLREKYGFRVSNFTVDSDSASPRACFQFSEKLLARADFSPYVSVAGQDKPALSVDDNQLCVEGLKHGDSYTVTLRQGLPSAVDEDLLKDAEFNIYVRDRSPSVRLSGKAYVLPSTGQQGVPLISVNTAALKVTIYRIGDRNLINNVLGYEFERNLYQYDLGEVADTKGEEVWSGELKVEKELNQEITTAFPISEAVPQIQPGVYLLAAEPADVPGDDYGERTTQWFIVSDYGLAAYSGDDGIHAFVNSLATTDPLSGVEVRLIARNNEVLSTATTSADGTATFAPGLARGEGGLAPALLVASGANGDYAFLNLKNPAFDLSDRGVAGRDAPAGLDAFVFTERGVYRTGETVHVTTLLRNPAGIAAPGVSLTLVVERPDGIEYRRDVVADQGIGGRALDVPLLSSVPTGTWRVSAYADPKQPAIGSTSFLVEDYVPERLEFDIGTDAKTLSPSSPATIALDGRFLYGAPASGLPIDAELRITTADERPGFPGYLFGLNGGDEDDGFSPESFTLADLPETDAEGKAEFEIALDTVPASSRPLEANVVVRLAEPGGRAVEHDLTLPITPTAPMIGVKPLFKGSSLGDQDIAKFDVVMAEPDGAEAEAKNLKWQLLRIETKYQWYRNNGYWQYEPIKITRRVADGTIDAAAGAPGHIEVPVTWGRYRLELETDDPQGPLTTYGFDSGWYAEANADTPDLLEIALDKPGYKAGDTMTVAVTARSAGKVTLSVIGDKLFTTTTTEVEPGQVEIPLTVGADWGTGAYVLATLRRPLDVEEKRMPGRAIGVQWFSIDKAEHTLGVALDLPDLIRPQTTLRVPVKLANLAPNDEARVVVSAVDVGILNLTGYEPPDPNEYYLGQRKLSAEIRDLYGDLIDGMQGTRGQIRTGGDAGAGEMQGSPPTQPPLALYSGIVSVGPDGTAEINFDIPAFTGTVRVMAVAWSKDKVGHSSGDVIVRDPVVVTATLPRFLLTGDTSTLRLDLDNVEGAAGKYDVAVSATGPLGIDGAKTSVALEAKKRGAVTFPVSAKAVGEGSIDVVVSGPDDFQVARRYALTVKPSTQILSRRTVQPLDPGQSITVSSDVFANLIPGTGSVALSVTPTAALDVASLLAALDRYPLGCTEQIISRALPLLYVNEMALDAKLAADTSLNERVTKAIETVLARQGYEGGFGLWSPGGADAWLDSYVTDFLTRAQTAGFAVPDDRLMLALNRLRNYVSTAPDVSTDGGLALSYALYVLARNGMAPVGDLRYIADVKLDDLATPTAQAEIGAALAMLGDQVRAEKAFQAAAGALPKDDKDEGRADFGSPLRDAAAVVTLAAEGNAPKLILVSATQEIEKARDRVEYTSTQEEAWLILAARALGKQNISLNVEDGGEDDGALTGALYRSYSEKDIGAHPVTVTNTGDTPLDAVISTSGAPKTPEPATDRGFKLERSYHTIEGEEVDIATAKQNERFVVLLTVTEAKPQFARVALTDYVPAGFEIDNPHLVSSADTGGLSWISHGADPVHTAFRDDRFEAAFDRRSDAPVVYTVAYMVRAVSPGHYVLPQASVEDMYRPGRFGRTGTGSVTVKGR